MLRLRRLARQSTPQIALALVAAGTWLTACGDDAKPGSPRGKGGSAGMAGSAGTSNAGTGGSAGSSVGGTAGTAGSTGGTQAGSAGTGTAGTAGTAGSGGTSGNANMGGEGGEQQGTGGTSGTSGTAGTGGTAGADQGGQGGEGGATGEAGAGGEGGAAPATMCSTADLTVTHVSATGTQMHDHLPINGTFRTTLLGMINTGAPLTFTLPTEGSSPHNHTLTFTAQQLTTLRNGGTVPTITSAVGGPVNRRHTHTFAIDCAP